MIWPTLWFMGEDVLLHSGKPERSRHATHTREQIRLVNAVQCKQPGQRVAGNPTPARDSSNFLLYHWDNFLGQESQIIVSAPSAGVSIFECRRAIPGNHIVVPVQIADGHQRERRAANSLCSLIYLLAFVREGVEVDDGHSRFRAANNRYRFS